MKKDLIYELLCGIELCAVYLQSDKTSSKEITVEKAKKIEKYAKELSALIAEEIEGK